MDHERNHIIYRISNVFDNDSYIGCTSQLLKYRLQDHVRNSRRSNCKLSIKIRGVGAENLEIVDLYTRCMTQNDAKDIERGLIDLLKPTLNMLRTGGFRDSDGKWDVQEYRRDYCSKNKEHKKEYDKKRNSIKTQCDCGGSYLPTNKWNHEKTKRHLSSISVFSSAPSSPIPPINPDNDPECHSE